MKRKDPLFVEVQEIVLRGKWKALCEMFGWVETALDDEIVSPHTVVELSPEQAKSLGVDKVP